MADSGPLRILLFGPTGQVGWELNRTLRPLGQVITAGRRDADKAADFSRPETLSAVIAEASPHLLVNAVAYTAVDKAEAEAELAARVNSRALEVIGSQAVRQGCPVMHYSTDYVFPGEGATPWVETDQTAPLSVYGKTKLEGEQALLASGADALILRTSWVYGTRGSNFLLTMLRLFQERESLNIVDDQLGAPTWSRMIAETTAQVLVRCGSASGFSFAERAGVYHLSASGETSWYGFAAAILANSRQHCDLQPISTDQYPTPAKRPAYSVLDNSKLAEAFQIHAPNWRDALALCMAELERT